MRAVTKLRKAARPEKSTKRLIEGTYAVCKRLAQLLEKSRCLGTAVPNSSFRTLLPGKMRIMVADGESEESLVAALRGELH